MQDSHIQQSTSSFSADQGCARSLDREDPLQQYRSLFHIPENTLYLNGNSLGLLSKRAEECLMRTLNEWRSLGIRGWFEAPVPWFHYAEKLGEKISPLVGADPEELICTGTTTVNLHSLASTFYDPRGSRVNILADELAFPSDVYALRSQIALRGLDPGKHLILAPSDEGRYLDEKRLAKAMTSDVALVILPSVVYSSGQLLDIPYLTAKAHENGIPIGFDCSHSVGVIPHSFDEWDLDFAFWCSYKYLNGGPGSSAFIYMNSRHFGREPGLAGWFGCAKDRQFNMELDFVHAQNAGGWQISSPNILSCAAVEGSLEIILEAGIPAIREKSARMTSFLVYLIDELLAEDALGFIVGSPRLAIQRGGHVALEHPDEAFRINEALKARGVVADFRPPNVLRICPSPLYNTYHEVWQVVQHLKEIVTSKEYEKFPKG
jgi:kynureninase